MIDPVTALGVATTAFNAIKTGFQAGRDVEGMAGDLSRWMGAVSDIKKAEELNQKPPLFKKLFAAGSVEEEALQTLMAKKKTEDMRDQLKNIIMFSRGHGAWEELLRTEADIRKKRQKQSTIEKKDTKNLGMDWNRYSHHCHHRICFHYVISISIHQRLHLSVRRNRVFY